MEKFAPFPTPSNTSGPRPRSARTQGPGGGAEAQTTGEAQGNLSHSYLQHAMAAQTHGYGEAQGNLSHSYLQHAVAAQTHGYGEAQEHGRTGARPAGKHNAHTHGPRAGPEGARARASHKLGAPTGRLPDREARANYPNQGNFRYSVARPVGKHKPQARTRTHGHTLARAHADARARARARAPKRATH